MLHPGADLIIAAGRQNEPDALSSDEIREVLGDDVPLSDPEVLGFIRSMLEEGLAVVGRR